MHEHNMPVIAFLSDFGLTDSYVGIVKGVIADVAPSASVIDITHDIPAGDITYGSFQLSAAYRFFPSGTVFLTVVDPEVGSERKAIVVQTCDHVFVSPDNGLLSHILLQHKGIRCFRIENSTLFRHPVSKTFHARDIFAPVAGHIASGMDASQAGPEHTDPKILPIPGPSVEINRITGTIICCDRFGNCISSISTAHLKEAGLRHGNKLCVIAGSYTLPVAETYSSLGVGEPMALVGSSGYLEIAVNRGRADKQLGLGPGDSLTVTKS